MEERGLRGGGWREEGASLSSWTELVFTTSEIAICWLCLLAPGIIMSFICKEILQTFIFYLKSPSNIRVAKYIFSEFLFQVDSFVLTLRLWLPSHPLPLLRKIHSIVKQIKDRINFWIHPKMNWWRVFLQSVRMGIYQVLNDTVVEIPNGDSEWYFPLIECARINT